MSYTCDLHFRRSWCKGVLRVALNFEHDGVPMPCSRDEPPSPPCTMSIDCTERWLKCEWYDGYGDTVLRLEDVREGGVLRRWLVACGWPCLCGWVGRHDLIPSYAANRWLGRQALGISPGFLDREADRIVATMELDDWFNLTDQVELDVR